MWQACMPGCELHFRHRIRDVYSTPKCACECGVRVKGLVREAHLGVINLQVIFKAVRVKETHLVTARRAENGMCQCLQGRGQGSQVKEMEMEA